MTIRYKISTVDGSEYTVDLEELTMDYKFDIQTYKYNVPIVYYRGGQYVSINPRNIVSIRRFEV